MVFLIGLLILCVIQQIGMERNNMNYLINYANKTYRKAQKLNTWTGYYLAHFDKVIEYSDKNIDKNFYQKHKKILENPRGNGLWLWKPYIIYKTLQIIKEDEIVFYCDSGACFFRSVKPILKILEKQDIWVSVLPLLEKQFTKQETFQILGCEERTYKDSNQISGTFIAVKKTEYSMKFVQNWLNYCCNAGAISYEENGKEEDYFIAHREDQSILSLLVKKNRIPAYQDPSQYGKLPEKYMCPNYRMKYYSGKDYPVCILHHRTKDADFKVLYCQWLCAVLPRRIALKFVAK